VYRIGNDNGLVLQSGISGIAASFDETSTNYAVIAEDFARGLQWNIGSSSDEYRRPAFAWKEAYTIAAIFTNISRWVTLSGTATLMEAGSSAGPWTARGSVPVQLSAGRNTPLTFPERKQEWGWLAPSIWVIYGDLNRLFSYTVEFNLTDDFGNTYAFRTAIATITVYVSEKKYGLAVAAFATMAVALVLYVISWLITPAPAGTVQGIAAGLGSAALDPPRPSKNFRATVRLPKRVRRSLGPQLEPLAAVMAEAALFARLDHTLDKIESRYLGAMEAKNTQAAKLQVNSYKRSHTTYESGGWPTKCRRRCGAAMAAQST
jgi:hypothetical protein